MMEKGWSFDKDFPAATGDTLGLSSSEGKAMTHIRDVYHMVEPSYNARWVVRVRRGCLASCTRHWCLFAATGASYTVPVVYDTEKKDIVSNESSEIIRFLNTGFNGLLDGSAKELDLYPAALKAEIDELNKWVRPLNPSSLGRPSEKTAFILAPLLTIATPSRSIQYKSGFATTQKAYEENVVVLFKALDRLEDLLSDGREFLVGGRLTEADVRCVQRTSKGDDRCWYWYWRPTVCLTRLYTTIVRFDPVYHGHFKCNLALSTSPSSRAILRDHPEAHPPDPGCPPLPGQSGIRTRGLTSGSSSSTGRTRPLRRRPTLPTSRTTTTTRTRRSTRLASSRSARARTLSRSEARRVARFSLAFLLYPTRPCQHAPYFFDPSPPIAIEQDSQGWADVQAALVRGGASVYACPGSACDGARLVRLPLETAGKTTPCYAYWLDACLRRFVGSNSLLNDERALLRCTSRGADRDNCAASRCSARAPRP
jgi:hypothetical protein